MVLLNGNPEVEANVFSKLSFYWVQKIFAVGNKRPLTEDDIFPIEPNLQSERLTALLEQQWLEESSKKKRPSLLVTLLKRHRWTLAWMFLVTVMEAGFRCAGPFLVAKVTSYFDPAVDMTQETALLWTGLLGILYTTMSTFRPSLYYRMERLGTSIRIAVAGMIYRKACRITQHEIGNRSVGLILNLITNDAQRLDQYIVPASVLLNLWAVLTISFVIMYYQLGTYASLAGFFSIFFFVPIQVYMGKCVLRLREKTAPLTDSRVKIVHEIILFMKVIKMYGWELMFMDLVTKLRLKETLYIGKFLVLKALNLAMYFSTSILSLMIVVTVKKYTGDPITTSQVFFFVSMMGVVRVYVNVFLGYTFIYIPQVMHSLQRIEDFLKADEVHHLPKKPAIMNLTNEVIVNKNYLHKDVEVEQQNVEIKPDANTEDPEAENVIVIDDMSSRWGPDSFSLSGLNLSIRKGELIAVVGPVACGKTTLLMSLIKELDHEGGLKITGGVGFSSQVPWIFNGNIEENIVFNRPIDEEKLNKCIESCYLTKDLEMFPCGLQTLVGERGVQLSGGQKTRVNLARAVYGEDPIILLDDPLSAVDSRCAKHIFNKLIKGHLSGKTRILVTHATHFLGEVDRIVVMDTDLAVDGEKKKAVGRILHIGTYSELLSQGIKLSVFSSSNDKKKKWIKTTSKISPVSGEVGEMEDESSDSDEETLRAERKRLAEEVKEETKTGLLDKRLYYRFLFIGLGYAALPTILIALLAPQILDIFQQQYAVDWLNYKYKEGVSLTEEQIDAHSETQYKTYVGLVFVTIFLHFAKSIYYSFVLNRAGRKLHNKALFSILRSPMRYFDTHPIGMTINRFSKDTYNMDELLPDVSHGFLSLLILYTASIILILVANYWFIFALIPIMGVVYFIVRYYLTTSVEIRRIEAITRSPIFSHISVTLSGLTTIRVSNQLDIYESQHYQMRDKHTQSWMMFKAVYRWFSARMDIVSALACSASTFLIVGMKDIINASIAGLSIVYMNNMIIGLQHCISEYTETENIMTAVERIYGFAALPPEAPLELTEKIKSRVKDEVISNKNVVSKGVIEFRNVKLKYDPDPEAAYILRNLSFVTRPSEKIGIVGRTGAGKSTILQALYRIVEPEGEILLDGMLTREMGLHQLRKSISIIPQESLLFSETLRVNLDPFSEFSDERLWDALDKVELKSYVSADSGGLEMLIQEGGGNLSAGQRQLLCLARALLRENKFLVIDEATANVDEVTDQLIQRTLREKFSKCTVLTIAHRINTIIDSDRIMVIDEGNLVEFEHPAKLLQNPDSLFYDLVQETGMFNTLYEQAQSHSTINFELVNAKSEVNGPKLNKEGS